MDLKDLAQREKFRSLLEENHEWPGHYQFKFILPTGQLSMFKALFPEETDFLLRPSSAGTYTSISIKAHLEGPDDVIAIYEKVAVIKGLISL